MCWSGGGPKRSELKAARPGRARRRCALTAAAALVLACVSPAAAGVGPSTPDPAWPAESGPAAAAAPADAAARAAPARTGRPFETLLPGAPPSTAAATVTGVWPPPGNPVAVPLDSPTALTLGPGGTLWVVEQGTSRLRRFHVWTPAAAGAPAEAEPVGPDLLGPGAPAAAAGDGAAEQLWHPHDVAVAPDGTLIVADTGHHRLVRLAPDGRLLAVYGGFGTDGGQFDRPTAVAVDRRGRIVVSDTGNDRIQILDPNGRPLAVIGRLGTAPGELVAPHGLALEPDGTLWVADTGNHRIQIFGPSGRPLAILGRPGRDPGGFVRPTGIALAPDDTAWVADGGNHRLVRLDRAGRMLAAVGSLGRDPGELQQPSDVAVGPDGSLYVADTANDRIQRLLVTPAALAAAEGASLYAAGLPDLARKAWQRGLAAAPGDPTLEAALGRAELAAGDTASAVERIGRALEVRPDDPRLHLLFARALVARYAWPLGAIVAAGIACVGALAVRWIAVRRLRDLADRHLAAGRRADAVRIYERVLHLARRDLRSLRALAALYEADGRREAARAVYARVLKVEPDYLPALRFLADHALASEAYDQASRLFARAVAADPARPIAHASLGAALAQLGDLAGADAALSRAIALLADREPAALARSLAGFEAELPLLTGSGPAARVFAAARRAAAAAHFAEGESALARGAPEAALLAFHRAACLEPAPADSEAGASLVAARAASAFEAGLAAYRVRDYGKAIEFFRAALAFLPTHEGAARHLRYALQCLEGSFRNRVQHLEMGETRE